MKVNFEKVIIPCVVNEVTVWHLEHGFLWDVVEVPTGRRLGVFFCTLLCGDGCVIHFDAVDNIRIAPGTIRYAFVKAVRMAAGYGAVTFATIPEDKQTLIRISRKLGFAVVDNGGFLRDGRNIVLLKYLNQ